MCTGSLVEGGDTGCCVVCTGSLVEGGGTGCCVVYLV